MTDLPHRAPGRGATSRRVVVGAAWAVPVIVAASTAPAYAASLAASLVFDTFTAYGADYSGSTATRIKTQIQVRREWSATTPVVANPTVAVPFPASVAEGGAAVSTKGNGWSFGSVSGSASTAWTYTFTWTGTLDNSTQSTPELAFLIGRRPVASTNVSLTAYVTAAQATAASRTISATI